MSTEGRREAARKYRKMHPGRKAAQLKAWQAKHPDRVAAAKRRFNKRHPGYWKEHNRKAKLKFYYGLSVEDYTTMLEKQDELCAICKQPNQSQRPFGVDHSHQTNAVRGLLCSRCNIGLVYIEDKQFLESALKYLGRYAEKGAGQPKKKHQKKRKRK